MLSDNFTVNVSPSLVPSGVVKDTPHVSCSPSPASKVPGVVVFSVRILTLGFIILLLISLDASAETLSFSLLSSGLNSILSLFSKDSFLSSSTVLSVSSLSSTNLSSDSFSISAVWASFSSETSGSAVWSAGSATSLFSSTLFSTLSFAALSTIWSSDGCSFDDWLSLDGSTLSSATISSPISPAALADDGEKSRA